MQTCFRVAGRTGLEPAISPAYTRGALPAEPSTHLFLLSYHDPLILGSPAPRVKWLFASLYSRVLLFARASRVPAARAIYGLVKSLPNGFWITHS